MLALIAADQLEQDGIDLDDPFGFLIGPDHAAALAEASYRLLRYEPGVHVVLVRTGNIAHLEQNISSVHRGPLPDEDLSHPRAFWAPARRARIDALRFLRSRPSRADTIGPLDV